MDQEVFATTYQEEVFQLLQRPVVVVNETWEQLGEKERELLTKIISALKISIDSITIVSQPMLDIPSFTGRTQRLIYFGSLPSGIAPYENLESSGISFICSQNLNQLIDNEPARKQLWLGLRKLFSV